MVLPVAWHHVVMVSGRSTTEVGFVQDITRIHLDPLTGCQVFDFPFDNGFVDGLLDLSLRPPKEPLAVLELEGVTLADL